MRKLVSDYAYHNTTSPNEFSIALKTAYGQGKNPTEVVMEMLIPGISAPATLGIWFAVSDILDQENIEINIRHQLIQVRDMLASCVSFFPDCRQAIENHTKASRKINEMRFLQSRQPSLMDESGVMLRERLGSLISEIFQHRSAPAELAYYVSDETLAHFCRLFDNWDDPAFLGEIKASQKAEKERRQALQNEEAVAYAQSLNTKLRKSSMIGRWLNGRVSSP